jgi:uncharacterized membrane protein YbhN (UPF0104 family)
MQQVLDAVEAFGDRLSTVEFVPLLLAVVAHLLKLAATSRAWRNVIAAAYPAERVRWRSVFAAYGAGVGVNAIIPARGGDVLRLYLVHRVVPASTYTTLASTLVVMSLFDLAMSGVFLGYALTLGVFPSFDALPRLPAFEFGWLVDNELVLIGVIGGLMVASFAFGVWASTHIRNFWGRIAQAFTVLRRPVVYLRTVAFWQAVEWSLRLVTIWFVLGAFGVDQTVQNVLLVQVTQSLATMVPLTPGGVGTEQALLFYVLRGEAPRSQLLAFSVGFKILVSVVNLTIGAICLAATLRTVRFRRAIDTARGDAPPREAHQDAPPGG